MHYLFREHWGILGVSPFCCSCCVSFCLSQITELQTAAFLRENGELGNGSVFITALWESFVKACMPLSPFASCSQRIDMIILWYFEITKVFFSLWQETLAPSWHQKDKLILQFLFFFFWSTVTKDWWRVMTLEVSVWSRNWNLKDFLFLLSNFKRM